MCIEHRIQVNMHQVSAQCVDERMTNMYITTTIKKKQADTHSIAAPLLRNLCGLVRSTNA